jgi:hypothetical protein
VTSTPNFILGIPHAPWRPERVESYRRLLKSIGRHAADDEQTRTFAEKCANYIWSEHMWKWAVSAGEKYGATHFLTLQDDVLAAPNFWRHLHAMVQSVPFATIGLESVHPLATQVAGHWYTTPDMLIGVGYVIPIRELREFLAWRSKLRKGALESMNEDQMMGVWLFATDRRIWHPVPTIIDHDVSLPSTYGNDRDPARRPSVKWTDREVPKDWPTAGVVDLSRFYRDTPNLARRWILDASEDDYQRWLTL